MITSAVTNSYKQEILAGIHAAADDYKIALYTADATLSKDTTAYIGTNEVAGIGYASGGVSLVGFTTGLSGDTAYIDWTTDPSWPDSTISARGALIYNASKENRAVASFDFGAVITSTAGLFSIALPAPGALATIRIA